jgi:hypothetical protein
MDIRSILSIVVLIINIVNTILAIETHYNKTLLYISLVICLIWCIYGYIEKKKLMFFGNLIILAIVLYIIIMKSQFQ